jgi:zinc transporter, ZIP family
LRAFFSAMQSTRTGLVLMSAIAMHNIPEGLAIAIPIFAATGNRWQALGMTLASGLSEPLGAGIGLVLLRPFLNKRVVDNAACAVGGVMIAVSFLELGPESLKHRHLGASVVGLVLGWLVISISVAFV